MEYLIVPVRTFALSAATLSQARCRHGLSANLNLGSGYDGQTLTRTLTVRNAGGSLFDCEVRSNKAWISVQPSRFCCQPGGSKRVQVKVLVNANQLTPSAQSHTANLVIDAGLAGKEQVAVSLTVPEPNLLITTHDLDLGSSYQGATLTGSFTVRNTGGSPFKGEISCDARWLTTQPSSFRCQPSRSTQIQVKANTSEIIRMGQHRTPIHIRAQAGQWQQTKQIAAQLDLPVWRTLWARFLRLMAYLLRQFGKLLVELRRLTAYLFREFGKLLVRYPKQAITLSVIVITVSSITFYAYNWNIPKAECYNNAETFVQAKEYAQAATAFEQCGWYRGAADRALDMHYQAGQAYFAAKQSKEAVSEFEQAGEYKDAAEMINEVPYQLGLLYFKEEKWKKAVAEFEKVAHYKNTPEMLREAHYLAGQAYFAAKQSEKAVFEFKQAGNYKDAAEMINEVPYQLGSEYFKEGEWEKAVVEFERAGNYKDAPEMLREGYYQAGLAYLEQERWQEGLAAFEQAGDYKNAPDIISDMYYQAGLTFQAQQEWEKAIVEFEQASDYKDAPYQLLQTHRQAYHAYLASGQNEAAEREFLWLNQWRPVGTLKQHTNSVFSVAFWPDGALLASASSDETIQLWHVKDGTPLQTLVGNTGKVWSLAFSPNETKLASVSTNKNILLWDLESGEIMSSLEGHTANLSSVAF